MHTLNPPGNGEDLLIRDGASRAAVPEPPAGAPDPCQPPTWLSRQPDFEIPANLCGQRSRLRQSRLAFHDRL